MSGRVEALEAALTEAAGQYGAPTDEQRNRWLALLAGDPPAGEVMGRPEEAEVRGSTEFERKYVEPLLMDIAHRREREAARKVAVLVDVFERGFAKLDSEREAAEAKVATRGRVIEAAREVVASIPGSHDEDDVMVQRHASALIVLADSLAACPADPKEQT